MLLICNQTCGQQAKLNFHTGTQMFKSKGSKKSALDLFPKKRKVDSSVGIVKYCQMKIKEKEESRKPCKEKEQLGKSNIDCLKYVGPSKPVESDKKHCKKSEDASCSNKVEEKPKEKPIIHSSKQPHCPSTLDRLSKEIQEIMARRIKVEELNKKLELDKKEKDCKDTTSSRSGKDNPLTGCLKACKKSEDSSCSNKVEEKPNEKPIIDTSKQPTCPSTLDRLSKEIQEIMTRRIKVEEQKKKPELDKKEKDFCKETSSSSVQVKKDDECLRRKVTAKTTPKTGDATDKKVLEPKHTKESDKEKAVQPSDECKELKSIKPAAGQCPEQDFKTTKPKKDCVTSKKDTKRQKPKLIRSSSCLKTSQSKNCQDYKPSASSNDCKSGSQKTKPHCDNIVETITSKKIECEDKSKKCEKLIATLTAGPKGLCQSRDDEAEEPSPVIAKDCKCDVTPPAKEPADKNECQPKPPTDTHQSIQKGLKGLTNMLPGSETNELKDMGLLRQCMFLAKENQRTPVTLPATDEELNKAMSEGQVFLCQVRKFGVGEKMICEELKQPDKEIEPSVFEEDGVEKVLKCALVRDKNNRERFICTEIFPKQAKMKEDASEAKQKIKIISNKLVCRKFPTPDGAKKEIFCTMARVEEIKSPREGDSCRPQNDRQTKAVSKPATAHLTRKCPDNSTNQDVECGSREETKNDHSKECK